MVQRAGFSPILALSFAALAAACGPDEAGIPDAGGGAIDAMPPPPDALSPEFTVAPTLEMAPNASTPLAGILRLETSVPTRVDVEMDDGERVWTIAFDAYATSHELTVLGFRPDREHTLDVTAITEEGGSATAETPLVATTDPLPADFPGLDLVVSSPSLIEPGVTMFSSPGDGGGYLILVDDTGEVVWYHRNTPRPSDARRLANGNLFYNTGDRLEALEVDMLGNIVGHWHAANSTTVADSTAVATDSFHHEVYELASGNFVAVSSEVRAFDDYPTSETDPTPQTEPFDVVGDVIVEFQRDGTIVGEWSLLDVLDPYRVGYDSFGGYWNTFYTDSGIDWTHANAVIHDPADDTFIVSSRHQDAVFKFDRSGELVWILGPHENWVAPWSGYLLTPTTAGFEWNYHQHAPAITPSGTLLVFDNGVYRASPPDPQVPEAELYSRALEVDIDPLTMNVAQVWEYDAERTLYARIVGDADPLPDTGNVLVTYGFVTREDAAEPVARIIEVTHETPAVEVWELHVYDRNPAGATIIYRAERLAGLYPPAGP